MQTLERARWSEPHVEARVGLLAIGWASLSLALAGLFPAGNPDTFGHLAQGRQIAQLGRVPTHDTFSFWKAAPAPWHNYEWLSDLLAWLLYDAGGANALLAIKCVTLAAAAALLGALAWKCAGPRAAMLCALFEVLHIPASRFRFTERPHLVTLPFSALYLLAFAHLLRARAATARTLEPRDRWVLAGLFGLHVLWVNVHGSHLLGFALTLIHLLFAGAGGARVRLALVLALQLGASCISPYGPAIVIDALVHTFDPVYRALVAEWHPWRAGDPLWLLLAPALNTVCLAIAAPTLWRGSPLSRALLGTGCLLALAAFRSLRFVADYLLLTAPVLAIAARALLDRPRRQLFAASVGVAALVISGGVASTAERLPPYERLGFGESHARVPAASADWLARHARAPRVLAAIEDAWYALFAVPAARVLMDGRVPFYGAAHIERVSAVFTDPHALADALEAYRIDAVLVRHAFAPQQELLGRMRDRPGWALVAIEDRYALYVRQDLALRDAGSLRRLTLEPGYDLPWLRGIGAERAHTIHAELLTLERHENSRGYVAWVRAMLAVAPQLRQGDDNGVRAPANAAEHALLDQIEPRLARAARGAESVPRVHAYHALVAAARCDLVTAERALDAARAEGESRETVLGAQEIALRNDDLAAVTAFLAQAEALPQARGDVWLASLRQMLRQPPACP